MLKTLLPLFAAAIVSINGPELPWLPGAAPGMDLERKRPPKPSASLVRSAGDDDAEPTEPQALQPQPRPPKKVRGQKQREHRDRLIASGGRYLSIELSKAATEALEAVIQVEQCRSAREAVERALEGRAAAYRVAELSAA